MTPDKQQAIRLRLQELMQWATADGTPAGAVKEVVLGAFGVETMNTANHVAALEALGRLLRKGNTDGNA